ncbi:pentatricopeptide repeat domain-containing protein [Spizellomyces punctatus DAOM BR117]|uniref:Pentatricopeptide repeat domain-containing protein n=1 Tax=Spizellomyces punctatus (strain DAOM BR117) TaxID=645134 RepID=A0A0L0HK61_SPIPD|nr:pentatricopeptide repeat domain-containing protein [Spizellomyces punctatus DAOM BR117]KND01497.1 pentatricopeptide repeat domain-containing protein [Spizellomyces punctatus DAOM BR117]|eukprot:XP_016609536.1 pentatricopeptide repeat domain-containing protein [Spizellomyces punctatus DAOM BR117]
MHRTVCLGSRIYRHTCAPARLTGCTSLCVSFSSSPAVGLAQTPTKPNTKVPSQHRRRRTREPEDEAPKIPRYRVVKINLDRLRHLSGWEKIELLRDLLKTKQPEEAVRVYTVLKENDLVARLKYQDYHELFHLLLADSLLYRDVILDVLSNLRRFGYSPSPLMFTALLQCCTKWRDLELASRAYEEMLERKLPVTVEAYNALLELHGMPRGIGQLQRGAELWRDMLHRGVRPNLESYLRALEIFGRLGQLETIKTMYQTALDNLDLRDLTKGSEGRAQNLRKEHIGHDPKLQLDNAFLSALVNAEAFGEAQKFFGSYLEPGGALAGEGNRSSRHLLRTYTILLKMCVGKNDPSTADYYWKELHQRGFRPNVVMYGQMITIHGRAGNLQRAREMFETAQERLSATPGSGKLMKLRTSLLIAYTNASEVAEAEALFEAIRRDCQEKGKPVLRSAVQGMIKMYLDVKDLEKALRVWERSYRQGRSETSDLSPSDGNHEGLEEGLAKNLTREDIIAQYQQLHPDG